jgi:hypothetical protein
MNMKGSPEENSPATVVFKGTPSPVTRFRSTASEQA